MVAPRVVTDALFIIRREGAGNPQKTSIVSSRFAASIPRFAVKSPIFGLQFSEYWSKVAGFESSFWGSKCGMKSQKVWGFSRKNEGFAFTPQIQVCLLPMKSKDRNERGW